jgi:hypothetical protein
MGIFMSTESTNERIRALESRVHKLSARVSANTAKATLHRTQVEENHFHILANRTATVVALRELAIKALESHLAECLQALNDVEVENEAKRVHVRVASLKVLVEHLKARIEINRGLIAMNKAMVDINKQMIALNSNSANSADEIVLAAASTDVHLERVAQEILEEHYVISDEVLDELDGMCDGLFGSVEENTSNIEELTKMADKNRVSIAAYGTRIHQLIDMVLLVSDYK